VALTKGNVAARPRPQDAVKEDSSMTEGDSSRLGVAGRLARIAAAGVLLGFAFGCPFAARLGFAVQGGSALAGAALLISAAVGACPAAGLLRRRSGS
jgi:hypothetical protein